MENKIIGPAYGNSYDMCRYDDCISK